MALGLPHIDFDYTTHSPVIKHSKGKATIYRCVFPLKPPCYEDFLFVAII